MSRGAKRRERCVVCGARVRSYESVLFGEAGLHCMPCFNDKAAAQMGILFASSTLQPVTVDDADGERHTFHVHSRLATTGHVLEAFEIKDERPAGHRFAVLGGFEADALSLLSLLCERLRRALAMKQLRKGELGWQLEVDRTVVGRIEADLENDMRLPAVTIEGREFSRDELGRMLMSFEGFNLELRVRDSIEVIGGPLLDREGD